MKTMYYLKLYIVLIVTLASYACGESVESNTLDCDKLQTWEEADALMLEVREDALMDSLTIVENLIGEWGLIGVVPGWTNNLEPGESCLRLTITSDQIVLEDLSSGVLDTSGWTLTRWAVNGFAGFYLETNEDVWNNRMGMETFSDDLMFSTGRVDDADTFIYEKLGL